MINNELKLFGIALIAISLVVGALVGYTLQKESDLQQINEIMLKSAYSESHLISDSEGNVYYITPLNYSNINISRDNLTGCKI